MMQWSEFDQIWFIFQHSLPCGPHTSSIRVAVLGFLWYRSSHPNPKKVLSCRCDLIIGPILLPSHVGEEKIVRWCQIRRTWRVINQFKATVTHSSHCKPQICVQEHCPGETGLPSSVFHAVHKMSLVPLFKVLNYLSSVVLSRRKQCS